MPVSKHLTKFNWVKGAPKTERFVEGNQVTLLTDAPQAFERMLAAIEAAEHSVWLEMYWFAADGIGQRFMAALGKAVDRGVHVAVHYDAWGSWGTPRRFFTELNQRGATVLEYNPVRLLEKSFKLATLTRRNHRKLLIVDARVAFTGGQNIADEWCGSERSPPWKDEVLEVTGPVVKELLATFLESWEPDDVAGLKAAIDGVEELAVPTEGSPLGMRVAVLTQSGFRTRRHAMRAYVQRMRAARRNICIANAYFLPNRTLVRELRAAARRGVDVRIIVAGRSDVPVVSIASRAVWGPLLRAGVKLYEWHESILHSKLAIVDGLWVTAGSFNLDYVSLRNNLELNLSVEDTAFAHDAEQRFEHWIQSCTPVDYDVFKRRSFWTRTIERFAHMFRAWL
jgi:cardiolipin synthase A/B